MLDAITWWGHELLGWLLTVNAWTAGLLAGAFLLDKALGKRARASWRVALYAPVGLRVLLPPSWNISLAHTPRVITMLTPTPAGFVKPPPVAAHAPAFTGYTALAIAYVAVALVIFVVRLRAYISVRRELRSARVARALSAPCPVLEHESLGPMVIGTIRPRIVVPSLLLSPEQTDALACVLDHESAHVRRGDPWLMAAIQAMTVACWAVLPLWIAAQRVRTLVEMACDERALEHADASARYRYGRALIELSGWRTVTLRPLGAGSLRFGSGLRARIDALGSAKRWPHLVQAGSVALAVGAFAACSSVGSSEGTANAPASARQPQGQGWTAPTHELRSGDELFAYCGPLLDLPPEIKPPVPAGGLPPEQVAFCSTPAARDLFVAEKWASEARNALGQIMKDSATYYEGTAVPSGRYQLCPSGRPVPKVMPAPDTKYQPKWPDDWNDSAGWQCMKFGMDAPMWFQYEYVSDGTHATAKAHGQRTNYRGEVIDVTFSVSEQVSGAGADRVLNIAPNIEETWVKVR